MAESLQDVRDWLKKTSRKGNTIAIGDSGLEIVVLDGDLKGRKRCRLQWRGPDVMVQINF